MNARFRNSGMRVELGRDRELEVMAGDALVVRGRLDLVATPAGRIGGVHEEDAAAAAVLGRREVVGDRAVRRRLDVAVGLRQDPEPVAHGGPGLGHRRLRRGDDLVGVRRGGATASSRSRREDPLEVVGADDLRAQLAVLAGQRLDLGQADVVDLLGAQPDRRVVADRRRVGLVAAGDPAQPGLVVGAGVWLDVVAERVAVRRRPPAGRRSR